MVENIIAIKYLILIAVIITVYLNVKNMLTKEDEEESARTFKQQDWRVNRFRAKHILEKKKKNENL